MTEPARGGEPVATLHCNDIGYVWARVTDSGKLLRFEEPMNLYTTLPNQAADSVLEDAVRYRWLREGNDAKHGAAWHIAVNLYGCEWDAAIDAARKQGEKQ